MKWWQARIPFTKGELFFGKNTIPSNHQITTKLLVKCTSFINCWSLNGDESLNINEQICLILSKMEILYINIRGTFIISLLTPQIFGTLVQ